MDANTKEVLLALVATLSPVLSAVVYYLTHRRNSVADPVKADPQKNTNQEPK